MIDCQQSRPNMSRQSRLEYPPELNKLIYSAVRPVCSPDRPLCWAGKNRRGGSEKKGFPSQAPIQQVSGKCGGWMWWVCGGGVDVWWGWGESGGVCGECDECGECCGVVTV